MATSPYINLEARGDNTLTRLDSKVLINIDEKLEKTIHLNNTTEIIDFSSITNAYAFIFTGTGEFTVAMTHTAQTITYTVEDFMAFTLDSVFIAGITNLTVGEANSADVMIEVRIYGKTVTA